MAALPLRYEQAASLSPEAMVWCARLRSGETVWEQPGLSSDSLPADDVVAIEYVPNRQSGPTVGCVIDVDAGERFVRYWTSIWKPDGRGLQRLFVLGIRSKTGRHALLAWYPMWRKLVLAATRPFTPPWTPEPFGLLPAAARFEGGPGMRHIGWTHEGFGAVVDVVAEDRLVMRASYR